MIADVETPPPGVLPEAVPAVPFEPGESTPVQDRHYRNRETRSPLCGSEASDDTPYARKWDDVTCQACVDVRPERGRKAKRATKDKPQARKQPKAETGGGPDVVPALPALVSSGVNMALFASRRPPAPPQELEIFSESVVAALDHYGLLEHTSHPLVPLVVSGAMLAWAIKDYPEITDEEELRKLHGLPSGSE